jgi:hypothetical protein
VIVVAALAALAGCGKGYHSTRGATLTRFDLRSADTGCDRRADAQNDIVGRPPHYRAPVWLDVGESDPFHDTAVAYAHDVHAQLHVWPGGHTGSYRRAHVRSYLRFYAASCS